MIVPGQSALLSAVFSTEDCKCYFILAYTYSFKSGVHSLKKFAEWMRREHISERFWVTFHAKVTRDNISTEAHGNKMLMIPHLVALRTVATNGKVKLPTLRIL